MTVLAFRGALASFAAATFLCSAPAAAAEYISSVGYNAGAGAIQQSQTTAGPNSLTIGAGGESATATTSNVTGGNAFASSITADRGTNFNALATAIIRYEIMLLGAPGVLVPVNVSATGYADGIGTTAQGDRIYSASSSFTLRSSEIVFLSLFASADTSSGPGRQTFSLNSNTLLTPNVTYLVELFARANSGGFVPSSAEAFADPVFTIDPAFASQYRLIGVPQAAASTAVPEPGSWALMLVGFGLSGFALRRRGKNQQLVSA